MTRVTLALLVAGVVALGGCAADDTARDATAPARTAASHSPTPDAGSPAPAGTTTGSGTPAATPAAPGHRRGGRGHKVGQLAPHTRAAADAHLLDADRLPTVGGRAWTVETDAPEGAVGACQKTDLVTIGATATVGRAFRAADGVTATQVVAEFADAKSAWRARRVLVAWRDDCESRVEDAAVGPMRAVEVAAGTGDSYTGRFASREAGLGVLRKGDTLTLVEVSARGTGYPSRWDPTRVALRRIARTF